MDSCRSIRRLTAGHIDPVARIRFLPRSQGRWYGNVSFLLESLREAALLLISLDADVCRVAATSLVISLAAVLMASLVGIPLGILVAVARFPGRSLLLGLLNALMAMPTVVVGMLLYGMLSHRGPLGEWHLLYTRGAIAIGQFLLIFPLIWNLSIAAVRNADWRIDYTSRILGASPLQRGLVLMDEMRYALLAAAIVGFGRAISEVGIAMIVGGNIHGFTRTMTTAIALETARGDFEFALALGILLLLIAFVVTFGPQQLQQKS